MPPKSYLALGAADYRANFAAELTHGGSREALADKVKSTRTWLAHTFEQTLRLYTLRL